MIRNTTRILCLLLTLCLLALAFVACKDKNTTPAGADTTGEVQRTGVWQNATYVKDTSFGNGSKTLKVTVTADNQSITFTIKSDAETVGAALLEHNLIAGEQSQYGLYVKRVNNILADWDTDGTYWAFYKGEEYMMTGVDSTAFADGDQYALVRTAG